MVIPGTRTEWVTLNSGSNGFKDVSAMYKDFGSIVYLKIEFLQWVLRQCDLVIWVTRDECCLRFIMCLNGIIISRESQE